MHGFVNSLSQRTKEKACFPGSLGGLSGGWALGSFGESLVGRLWDTADLLFVEV